MTVQLSRPWTWLSLIMLSVVIPVGMAISCGTSDGGALVGSAGPGPGSTPTVSPTSTSTSVLGSLCGDAGCAVVPTPDECDGGSTFTILGGQTWDVISPLNPRSLNYSVYWWAGNIGYRRPQVRLTKGMNFSRWKISSILRPAAWNSSRARWMILASNWSN